MNTRQGVAVLLGDLIKPPGVEAEPDRAIRLLRHDNRKGPWAAARAADALLQHVEDLLPHRLLLLVGGKVRAAPYRWMIAGVYHMLDEAIETWLPRVHGKGLASVEKDLEDVLRLRRRKVHSPQVVDDVLIWDGA